jgi:hypothetical protein
MPATRTRSQRGPKSLVDTSTFDGNDVATHTITFTTKAEGDLLVIGFVTRYLMTGAITGITDTGATPATGPGAWAKAEDQPSSQGASPFYGYTAVWYAKCTAVGTFTATITITGAGGANYTSFVSEFSGFGPGTEWKVIATGANNGQGQSPTNFNTPALTPTGSNQVYYCANSTAEVFAGNGTAGYSYVESTGAALRWVMYSTSQPSGSATSASFTQTGGSFGWANSAAIFAAT